MVLEVQSPDEHEAPEIAFPDARVETFVNYIDHKNLLVQMGTTMAPSRIRVTECQVDMWTPEG